MLGTKGVCGRYSVICLPFASGTGRTITQPSGVSEIVVFGINKCQIGALLLATGLVGSTSVPTSAAVSVAGRVQVGGGAVAP